MAITFIKVKVRNPGRRRAARTFNFLVDSGAIYTVIPSDQLKALGIRPTSHEEFMLADGETLRMAVGNAEFEYHKKQRAAPVIFGKEGVYLLGATTLEALGLMLDPIHRELKPLPMLLM